MLFNLGLELTDGGIQILVLLRRGNIYFGRFLIHDECFVPSGEKEVVNATHDVDQLVVNYDLILFQSLHFYLLLLATVQFKVRENLNVMVQVHKHIVT